MKASRSQAHHVAQMHIATPLGCMVAARSRLGLSGLWFQDQGDCPPELDAPVVANDPILNACAAHLDAYWSGATQPAWPGPTDLHGTEFQRQVWHALRAIPCGETASYGDLARRLNRPQAQRAVGAAVGANPISVLIPCHRVIGSLGALTGFSGGMHRKIALLQHEGYRIQQGRVALPQAELFSEASA